MTKTNILLGFPPGFKINGKEKFDKPIQLYDSRLSFKNSVVAQFSKAIDDEVMNYLQQVQRNKK